MGLTTMERITADPAAGGELSFTADEDMLVHCAYFTLVTSIVVANRRVHLAADDGVDIFFRNFSTYDQAGSQTIIYTCNSAEVMQAAGANGVVPVPLPVGGLKLRAGDRLRTITANRDSGDNYTSAVLQVERL